LSPSLIDSAQCVVQFFIDGQWLQFYVAAYSTSAPGEASRSQSSAERRWAMAASGTFGTVIA
jgi:hypothetical protein